MLTTYELRWFYFGQVPPEIQSWFEHECLVQPLQPPEVREDFYLYCPQSEFLGIKLRQERLEVKWRKAELGVVCFSNSVEGKLEKWGKWLCSDPTRESFHLKQVANHSTWVGVKKVRYSQLYQVSSTGSLQPVGDNESVHNGCRVELTHLKIREMAWWTLAFEATGDEVCLMDNLRITARKAFHTNPRWKFSTVNSYAYPCWLAAVCQKK